MFLEFLHPFLIFKWIDLIEISFFSMVVYYFSLWLYKDKQKNLLPIFYSYYSILVTAHFFGLTTITNFLIAAFPVAIMILVLVHQTTLQKNIITFKKLTLTKELNTDWVETILRICLKEMNNKRQLLCLIEGSDSLKSFIKTDLEFNVNLKKELLETLLESSKFDPNKMIYISNAKLISINTEWNFKNERWVIKKEEELDEWKENAILFSSKTDAIVFKTYPLTRTFDIVFQGKLIEKVNNTNALTIIEQYLRKNNLYITKDIDSYETTKYKKSSFKQHHN